MDVFPGWKDYTQRLEQNWRSLVKESDTVVIAGDISWAMKLEETEQDFAFIHQLPGEKILMKGNHDYWWSTKSKIERFLQEKGLSLIHIYTPGVLWPKFEDKKVGEHLAFTGAVKDEVVDIEHLACRLIETLQEIYPNAISQRYQLENTDLSQMESYEILEAIGKKRGMLMSGGVVNTERAAIAVVDEFRSAKLGKITLEQVEESV